MNDYIITVNGIEKNISVNKDNYYIGEKIFTPKISRLSNYSYLIEFEDKVFEITCNQISDDEFKLTLDGYSFNVVSKSVLENLAGKLLNQSDKSTKERSIKTPMPGLVSKLYIKEGDEIEKGTPLFILEAMKMENIIKSDYNGIVTKLHYNEGASVEKDTVIVSIS